jgi:SAM-dependent methyltransferase
VKAALAGAAVLDVRGEPAFGAGHLDGAGHVPLAELEARRAELPPRERPVIVVADDPEDAERAARALAGFEFPDVRWLDVPVSTLEGGAASRGPAVRLWRVAPFLDEVLPAIPRGRAADLAAGSGREAVHLAGQGFAVEAWDIAPEALERAAALAAREGVAFETVVCDLEAPDVALPAGRYALIVCFRFLHRPLFPAIAEALAPGGHLVYETFRVGQERFGKPRRPRFLLEPGELARAFPGLEILRHEEPDPAGGPLTARLWARRRGGTSVAESGT